MDEAIKYHHFWNLIKYDNKMSISFESFPYLTVLNHLQKTLAHKLELQRAKFAMKWMTLNLVQGNFVDGSRMREIGFISWRKNFFLPH
jgi:hypothetical protein